VSRPLGQHSLTDPSILDRIVGALNPQPDDVVIEVGPGKGALTRRLAPRVGIVIAIERDRRLAADLQAGAVRGEPGAVPENVRVVVGDAVEVDWHELLPRSGSVRTEFKVVGNIPYYITSPLIEKALRPPRPRVIVYLMQREVADRLAAGPGTKTYGALSVGVQVDASVERLFVVPAGAFRPRPAVDSALVRLAPRARPLVPPAEHEKFRAFVTRLFGQRRKQLLTILRSTESLCRDEALDHLAQLGIDPTSRPEVLEPQMFVRLYGGLHR
jgi:16S rRNA (adenine1518-N6/adenine1519-N6)-dimethyltransferase